MQGMNSGAAWSRTRAAAVLAAAFVSLFVTTGVASAAGGGTPVAPAGVPGQFTRAGGDVFPSTDPGEVAMFTSSEAGSPARIRCWKPGFYKVSGPFGPGGTFATGWSADVETTARVPARVPACSPFD